MKNDLVKKQSVLASDLSLAPSELFVHDLSRMIIFYNRLVGLDLIDKTSQYAFLGHGSTPVIKLTARPNLKFASFPSAGLFHNAIVFKSRSRLAKSVKNILEQAPEYFSGTGDHLVSEAFYFNDPEGNGLELYFDRPKNQWQWHNGRVTMDTLYIDPENYLNKYLDSDQSVGEKHLGHVHLRVGDIPQARKFYVDNLGFDITFDMPQALFLSVGGYHHHIGANTWMSQGAGARTPALGLAEFDVVLPSSKDLDNLANRLKAGQIKFEEKAGKLQVLDPWSNKIVFLSK